MRVAACTACLLAAGCGTMAGGRRWGEDATPTPGWGRVLWAAERAALDPGTWVPAVGALAVRPFDKNISQWAHEHTPIFGSPKSADRVGDDLHSALRMTTVATTFATPSGPEPLCWTLSKANGLAVDWTVWQTTSFVTSELKRAVDRTRPNGDERSFPSSHASESFADATLTSRNLDAIAMPDDLRTGLQVTTYAAASATAWARVEAGVHYPSDVLAGAALGRFFGSFIQDTFLGLPRDEGTRLEIAPSRNGGEIAISIDF